MTYYLNHLSQGYFLSYDLVFPVFKIPLLHHKSKTVSISAINALDKTTCMLQLDITDYLITGFRRIDLFNNYFNTHAGSMYESKI